MSRILLVEDEVRDVLVATQIASSAGITNVEARDSLRKGIRYLEACVRGESPHPFAIVVDIDLGRSDNGYELLRLRYSTPLLRKIPIIVWTHLDESARAVCDLFDVDSVVFKWEGAAKLREALEKIIARTGKLRPASPIQYLQTPPGAY
jgi:CheY-like chemotaxis protein